MRINTGLSLPERRPVFRFRIITQRTLVPLASFLVLGASLKPASATAEGSGSATTELYATASDGTRLHWDVYTPSSPGPWPAVLVIHGGDFNSGRTDYPASLVSCAQDLAAAGYITFSIEYRLAPPGSLPGQSSSGQFPDQTDDVSLAIKAARADRRCNGQVGAVGGSAGGSHATYLGVTGALGANRPDVVVSLSGGYDFSDFSPNPNLQDFTSYVTGYIGVDAADTADLRNASPAWTIGTNPAPLLMVNSVEDSMPYSQLGDMLQHLDAFGLANYQVLSILGNNHSFDNWPEAKQAALTFLANGFAGIAPPPPLPSPAPADLNQKLLNVSTRTQVGTGDDVMVGGFIISGTEDKRVILRALGPSLGAVGVSGALANPTITLNDFNGVLMESNDNRLLLPGVANALLPTNAQESYLTAVLPPGSYTAIVSGVNSSAGVGLIELYDEQPANSLVANLSTRGYIPDSTDPLIGGVIVGGATPTEVITRALGPSLGPLGIVNPLPNPTLDFYDSNGSLISSNEDWQSTQAQQISATGLAPTNPLESAVVQTLSPGAYTAVVRDASGASGVALVEIYNLSL